MLVGALRHLSLDCVLVDDEDAFTAAAVRDDEFLGAARAELARVLEDHPAPWRTVAPVNPWNVEDARGGDVALAQDGGGVPPPERRAARSRLAAFLASAPETIDRLAAIAGERERPRAEPERGGDRARDSARRG